MGSGGRDHDLMMLRQAIGLQAEAVKAQGSMSGPLVTVQNLYASAIKVLSRSGIKTPELFFSDPSKAPAQPPAPPDPAVVASAQAEQAKVQLDGQKLQLEGQKAQASAQNDAAQFQLEQAKLQLEARKLALAEQQAQQDAIDRAHARQMSELEFQRSIQDAEADRANQNALELTKINAQFQTQVTVAQIKSQAEQFRAHADIVIQASEHDHAHQLAEQQHAHAMERQASAPEPVSGSSEGGE